MGAILLGLLTSLAAPEGERVFAAAGDAVLIWNDNAGIAATEACLAPLNNPLHESRIYAMMHVAIHDALNAIDRRSRPYAYDAQADAGASPDAAVAAAARYVLVPLIGHSLSSFTLKRASMQAWQASSQLTQRPSPRSRMARPRCRALRSDGPLLPLFSTLRAADGAVGPFLNFDCPQETEPGEYQCTPGTPVIAFEVWADVTPFVLHHSSQFRPGPPYAVDKKEVHR